jgi:hypothetical protein
MSKGALAHRIEILEARLAASVAGDVPCVTERSEQPSVALSPTAHKSTRTRGHFDGLLRFLTLGTEGSGEPAYLGPSSGLSIADAVGTKSLPVNSNQQLEVTSQNDPHEKPLASPPSDANGSRIIDAYFTHMHTRLPFLDRAKIMKLHANRFHPVNATPQDEFERFKLFMVYAIGATILQMTGAYDATPPNEFLMAALNFDRTLRESLSVASIEAMMLLVVYNLRSSSHSSVWYMIGLAMRTCIDFGFHREARYRKLRPLEAEAQRRLFWSVYIIERYSAWSLGRPFSISEEEIDVQPPLDLDDSATDDNAISRYLQPNPGTEMAQPKGTMSRFIASVRLQRIVSQIHTRIYRVDKKASTLFSEIAPLMAALNNFRETLPSLDLDDRDFVHMHWHNSVRMLIQPFLSILESQDELISTCIASSGSMCQLFKRLRQRDFTGYSFLLANSVFMAGLTMWYETYINPKLGCSLISISFCLFRSPALWTPTVSNDLRACSSSLFVMAECNPRLKKHRDGLESVINKAMDHIQESAKISQSRSTVINREELDACQVGQVTPEDYAARVDFNVGGFDTYMADVLSNIQSFPLDFQAEETEGDGTQSIFPGAFTEEFWATDSFNQPMLNAFGWKM